MSSIHIKITDGIKLKTGSKQMTFNESGGYIGSATDCQWVVQDVFNKINDKHVHIKSNGDNFCLMPCKGSQVYMNGDHSPIITNYYIILSIGDIFKIGDIELPICLNNGIKGCKPSFNPCHIPLKNPVIGFQYL